MKSRLIYLIGLSIVIGCSSGISSSERELYKITDAFVQSLQTTYESYGLLGGVEHSQITRDSTYKITPIGRLINVKIQKVVSDDEYKQLRHDLEVHYRKDKRVNNVYICEAGTVMIDCRN